MASPRELIQGLYQAQGGTNSSVGDVLKVSGVMTQLSTGTVASLTYTGAGAIWCPHKQPFVTL